MFRKIDQQQLSLLMELNLPMASRKIEDSVRRNQQLIIIKRSQSTHRMSFSWRNCLILKNMPNREKLSKDWRKLIRAQPICLSLILIILHLLCREQRNWKRVSTKKQSMQESLNHSKTDSIKSVAGSTEKRMDLIPLQILSGFSKVRIATPIWRRSWTYQIMKNRLNWNIKSSNKCSKWLSKKL